MADAELLLHVGYPKTATTWLQQHVFGEPNSGFCTPWSDVDFQTPGRTFAARDWVVRLRDADNVQRKRDAIRSELKAGFDLAAAVDRLPVVSEETLIGWIGSRTPELGPLELLAELFPRASVLLTIREQRSMIASCFAQSIADGATSDLPRFLTGPQHRGPGRDDRHFHAAYLRYDVVFAKLRSLFPRVQVVPMEWLRQHPRRLEEALSAAAGRPMAGLADAAAVSANARLGPGGLALLRRVNRVWPRSGRYALRWTRSHRAVGSLFAWTMPFTKPHAPIIADFARGKFEASNHRLERDAGIDLGSLGYAV